MQCKACGAELTSKKQPCPQCGYKEKSKAPYLLLLLIPAALLVILLVVGAIVLILGLLGVGLILMPAEKQEAVVATAPIETVAPTIAVYPTEATEPPLNMANPYIALHPDRNADFFPDSNSRYLNSGDLKDRSITELLLIRNEIFARHGYAFTDPELSEHFLSKNWYTPTVPASQFSESDLNDYEVKNVALIKIYEQRLGGIAFSPDNPYAICYSPDVAYLLPASDAALLSPWEISGLSAEEACIARNEILARHGYTFSDTHLLEYFLHQSWYYPDTPPGQSDSIQLTDTEQQNIQLLKDHESTLKEIEGLDTAFTGYAHCDFFSVTTPAYWMQYCEIVTGSNSISFNEWDSKNAGYGGHVFTLSVFSSSEEYEYHPHSQLLGYLTDAEGYTWHLVALYPTDVQCAPEAAILYGKMCDARDAVIATISAAAGYAYNPV